MKPYSLLLLSAVGIGTLGVSASSATPMSGVAIDIAASANQMTRNVRWCGLGCGWGTWGYSRGWGPGWSDRDWSPGGCHCQPSRCGPWQSPGAVECVNFVFPGISQRPAWCRCRP